jgi:class 3 adenylate cyclase
VPGSRGYFLSVAAGGLAFSVRAVFDPFLLDNAPFIFFLPAVLVACYFLGKGPALLTTVLGLFLGDVFFQTPRGAPTVSYDAFAEGLAYLIVAFLIVGFWPAGRRFRAWLERGLLDLDRHGAQQPVGLAQVNTGSRDRRLAAVLAADVAGYSRLMGADEEGTLAALKTIQYELTDPSIAAHRGRVVKTTGDGTLVEFASVVDAVRCAVQVQDAMAERNANVPVDKRIELRIGINVGDILIDGDDIFGDGVNIAARLEALAAPGGICVSRFVRDQVRDRLDLAFEDLGKQTLKNIANPIQIYRIALSG